MALMLCSSEGFNGPAREREREIVFWVRLTLSHTFFLADEAKDGKKPRKCSEIKSCSMKQKAHQWIPTTPDKLDCGVQGL